MMENTKTVAFTDVELMMLRACVGDRRREIFADLTPEDGFAMAELEDLSELLKKLRV